MQHPWAYTNNIEVVSANACPRIEEKKENLSILRFCCGRRIMGFDVRRISFHL